MATDTTALSYWLNWRFLLCAIGIVVAMIVAALVIWRYEGRRPPSSRRSGDQRNKGASWATSSSSIHPVWLLGYRIVAFCTLLGLILADTILHGVGIFYYYTQWTFTLVTIYFGMASSLSILGCLRCCIKRETKGDHSIVADTEHGLFVPPLDTTKTSLNGSHNPTLVTPSIAEYAFQIIFQICAGAVMLTDSVYWLVLYSKEDNISFLHVCMHSVNAVFLLGDTILNALVFSESPFLFLLLGREPANPYRIGRFALKIYRLKQWIIHACVSMRYLGVGLMHIPLYGIFSVIFKIKRRYSSR
ncbi:hypothetical protein SASPL_140259 [Salvia splendens]|uniref:Uncharacterized protein n=1 Tax=Salvia splendens TaxID=180675 RepID=A0A8X8ZCB5_SALSN|nr:hypothetical protein SASPL_140259 [Salvia splendens]